MLVNRIRGMQGEPTSTQTPAVMVPVGFVVAPVFVVAPPVAWQLELYRVAYEQARAAAAIPRHHRQLFSVWN